MVERSDIEAKVREIEATFEATKESVQQKGVLIAVAVVAVVALAFVLGRRRGSRSRAIVKVYRA